MYVASYDTNVHLFLLSLGRVRILVRRFEDFEGVIGKEKGRETTF